MKENLMVRFSMILTLLALFLTMAMGVVSAQDAATPFVGRTAPDPSLCTVAARPAAILTPVAGATTTPTAGPATPQAASEPAGETVTAQTETEVTAAIQEVYACLNGGNPLQTLALFTDPAAVSFLATHPELALSDELATPATVENRIALVAITDLRLLPDGRVFALVTQDDPTRLPDGPEPVFFTFVKQGDRWLVDDLRILSAEA
jgi:hypothetical protein